MSGRTFTKAVPRLTYFESKRYLERLPFEKRGKLGFPVKSSSSRGEKYKGTPFGEYAEVAFKNISKQISMLSGPRV